MTDRPDEEAPSGDPPANCRLCPRLVAFREANRVAFRDFHNAPVASFGEPAARLLVVGLAPGLKGANRTGRPFTGDYAGDLLYPTLVDHGFASGRYEARPDDGLTLVGCRITNAVRCVPPENRPTTSEIKTCRRFLAAEMAAMPRLAAVLALGTVAHNAVLAVTGRKAAAHKFAHGAVHDLDGITLHDSYHCSRYNLNTRRLTEAMFHAVFDALRARLAGPA